MRAIITVAYLLLIPVMGSQPNGNVDLCAFRSQTPPPALTGAQGQCADDKYWFTHRSDVEVNCQKYRYIFTIRNEHPVKYLPAEWRRGDGTVQVAFERIAPEGCGGNYFETYLGGHEDPDGAIAYGPTKQHNKDAPLYVTGGVKQQGFRGDVPKLTSKISVDLKQGHELLEFTTQVEGDRFITSVTNLGTNNQRFRIPEFSRAWETVGKLQNVEIASTWQTHNGAFIARRGEPDRHVISVNGVTRFRDQVVQVELLSSEGKPIAAGHISVYLPDR